MKDVLGNTPVDDHPTGRSVFAQLRDSLHKAFDRDIIDIDEFGKRMAEINREEKLADGAYIKPGIRVEIQSAVSPAYQQYVGLNGKVVAVDEDVIPLVIEFDDGSWDVFHENEVKPV